MSDKKYVCNQAKIECQMCTNPQGTLMVTSNMIKLQGKLWATEKDKEKTNLLFQGTCKQSPNQAVPCVAVIQTGQWQGTGDISIQGSKALLENSTIMCNYGGATIKIKDDLQKSQPSSLLPSPVDGITPETPVARNLVSSSISNEQGGAMISNSNNEIEDNASNNKIEKTYFVFLDEISKKPISGLTFYIETTECKMIKKTTNQNGVAEISNEEKPPFIIYGYFKNSKIKSSNDSFPDITGKHVYSIQKSDEKPATFVKTLKDKDLNKDEKLLIQTTKLKLSTGDTLDFFFEQYLPDYTIDSNKGKFLMDFNFGNPIKGTYRKFDFGQEGEFFIPNFEEGIGNLKEKVTHILYLSKVDRTPLTELIIDEASIIKRDKWAKHALDNYDILKPSLIKTERTPIEFDWNYHTIVLHHSGDGLTPTIEASEDLHSTKNDWEDVGYHFLIGRSKYKQSKIYEGRPLVFKGSHASKDNSNKIGILLEGDFDHQIWDLDDDVESQQIVLLKTLIEALLKQFPIKRLIGHSDVLGKEIGDGCPGEALYKFIPDLRKEFNLTD